MHKLTLDTANPLPHLAFVWGLLGLNLLGSSGYFRAWTTLLLARPCKKPFSAPDSGTSIYLASLCANLTNKSGVNLPGDAWGGPSADHTLSSKLTTYYSSLHPTQWEGKVGGESRCWFPLTNQALLLAAATTDLTVQKWEVSPPGEIWMNFFWGWQLGMGDRMNNI